QGVPVEDQDLGELSREGRSRPKAANACADDDGSPAKLLSHPSDPHAFLRILGLRPLPSKAALSRRQHWIHPGLAVTCRRPGIGAGGQEGAITWTCCRSTSCWGSSPSSP